ncbi:MAG: rhombotarget lipoprotein, partial [Cocleimonas sp.]
MKQQQTPNDTLGFSEKILLLSLILLISGCSGFAGQQTRHKATSSSLSHFLYPEKQTKMVQAKQIPQLTLPVKIGIAFLPSQNWSGTTLDSHTEYQLLSKVKKSFSQYRFIDTIDIIPSTYLRHRTSTGGTGFDTLTQVARLHNVDLIALVSYDQLIRSQHNSASLLYWTIAGMYVIPGNENTIQTFVDTA